MARFPSKLVAFPIYSGDHADKYKAFGFKAEGRSRVYFTQLKIAIVCLGVTGYLATPEDAEDFCNGIVQLLDAKNLRDRMSQQCRAIAQSKYSSLQAKAYIELYRQVLKG